MPVPPTIIDLGNDTDAGSWLAALPFVRFPVSDFDPLKNERGSLPNADCISAPVSLSLHSTASNQGEIRNHGG